jgi:hypothetical protein
MLREVLLNDFAQRDLAQPPVAAVEPLERDRRRKSHPARRVPRVSAENYLSTAGDSAMQRTRWAVNVPAKETGVEMTAVEPIAAVTTASARVRTDCWLGAWDAQTAAE